MSVRANPTVIGAFVLGASIVLVAGLLFWGGTGLFKQRVHWVMYFDSAVTGLQKGAPVLMRGVRIGEVKDIQIRWGKSLVGVYADMEPDSFHGVPPSDVGVIDFPPDISGKSSLSSTVMPLIFSAEWISLPSGPGTRPSSSASKALT